MKIAFVVIAVALSFNFDVCAEESSAPDAAAVLEFSTGQYFSELVEKLHDAKDDTRLKTLIAKRYYGNLFMLWFSTRNPPLSNTIKLNLEGHVESFKRYGKKYGFAALVDYDDPMSMKRVPADVDRILFGPPFFDWFMDQIRDPKTYADAVKKFRDFVATVELIER